MLAERCDNWIMVGLIRLVDYLSQSSKFGNGKRLRIIVDCGTGTTAVGLALGIALHRYVRFGFSLCCPELVGSPDPRGLLENQAL